MKSECQLPDWQVLIKVNVQLGYKSMNKCSTEKKIVINQTHSTSLHLTASHLSFSSLFHVKFQIFVCVAHQFAILYFKV